MNAKIALKLTHAIRFVADMDRAVAFHRDALGLKVRFTTPGWSEFETGEVTVALHAASAANPAGTAQLGFGTDDLAALYARREALGLRFREAPRELHGSLLATIIDCDGAEVSLSSPAKADAGA